MKTKYFYGFISNSKSIVALSSVRKCYKTSSHNKRYKKDKEKDEK